MRSFIAIELPDTIKKKLEWLETRLHVPVPRITWVRPPNMHLTLRFLGNITADQAMALCPVLTENLGKMALFSLTVGKVGAFPNRKSPNVIWAGIDPVEGPLATVQACTERAASFIGLPPETRPFCPHLTLGRIREPKKDTISRNASAQDTLPERLKKEMDFCGGDFTVRTVSLFSSELTAQGPRHDRLQEFPLATV